MALLLVFVAAGVWHPRWLPRWLAQLLAVVLAAPLATYLVYLPSTEGDLLGVLRNEWRLHGFLWITGSVLFVAPALVLGALYRERDAQARSQALQFALERSTLEKQALDAELKLLHAQIQPHFLFNTLANVQALVESGSPRAAPVLQHLITYLGSAMPRLGDAQACLGSEGQLVRAYLELMHMRMPDRLEFAITLPPELEALRFPAMALLTLVENAVHHGIDPSEDGGRIAVTARPFGDLVRIEVADTGVGMDPQAAPGTGLSNLRARLAAFFGPGATLELDANRPRGVVARIVVPRRP
jgi:sensor histidine kinase YesM